MARLWPSPLGTISIGFTGNSVVAVRTVCVDGGCRITHVSEERLPFTPFADSTPREEDCAALSEAMQRLAGSVPQTYWPLQIALPDPAAICQVMEFEVLPETVLEREDIAQFRLGKEFPALPQMQCATQVISKEGEKSLLLTTFIQRAWLDCLNNACRAAGFVPSVIDSSMSFLFNRFYEVVRAGSGDGVLISVEPESWSILFWDGDKRPRFVRSRWCDSSTDKDGELGTMVQDIERLIMSYALCVPGRRIDGIYLCANEDDRASIVARLDKRMQIPCIQLDVTESFSMMPGQPKQKIPLSVLATAEQRI